MKMDGEYVDLFKMKERKVSYACNVSQSLRIESVIYKKLGTDSCTVQAGSRKV